LLVDFIEGNVTQTRLREVAGTTKKVFAMLVEILPYGIMRELYDFRDVILARVALSYHPDLVALGIILLEVSAKRTIPNRLQTQERSLQDDWSGKAEAAWRRKDLRE